MSVNTPPGAGAPEPNTRRIALAMVGLVAGLVIILIGLNTLSTSDAPPPETPRVQTGSLPPGTTSTTAGSTSGLAPGTVSVTTTGTP